MTFGPAGRTTPSADTAEASLGTWTFFHHRPEIFVSSCFSSVYLPLSALSSLASVLSYFPHHLPTTRCISEPFLIPKFVFSFLNFPLLLELLYLFLFLSVSRLSSPLGRFSLTFYSTVFFLMFHVPSLFLTLSLFFFFHLSFLFLVSCVRKPGVIFGP